MHPYAYTQQASLLKRSPFTQSNQTHSLGYENNVSVNLSEKSLWEVDADLHIVFVNEQLNSLCPNASLEKIEPGVLVLDAF